MRRPRALQHRPSDLGVGHNFDARRHIFEVQVESPGTDAQAIDLAAKLFAGMLDRDKPLWEMYLVRGLEGNRSAIVSKVHHCLVDGVSGIELLMLVFDVTANPPPPMPAPEVERPPMAGPLTRLTDAIFDNLSAGLDRWADSQKSLVDSAFMGDNRGRQLHASHRDVPALLPHAGRTRPIQQAIQGQAKAWRQRILIRGDPLDPRRLRRNRQRCRTRSAGRCGWPLPRDARSDDERTGTSGS